MPKSKKEKPSVSPTDLAERIAPQVGLRAKALVRRLFGDVAGAGDVLERLAELLKALDEEASEDLEDQTARGVTADRTTRDGTTARRTSGTAARRRR